MICEFCLKAIDSQFDTLRIHAVYRDRKFVSTTKSENIATEHFDGARGKEYTFKIKKSCTNAVTLQVSEYEEEQEVLLTPYSPLLVIGKDKKKKLVQFAVLGDEVAKKHLESGEGRDKQGLRCGYS
jgi:hypothetical protein